MINNKALGIIFANANDKMAPELTRSRSMASVPFGARYRFIDFPLSNLVNAGINKVGVITKENYLSLMDHLGSGKHWDLDRKNGGLFIFPPYSTIGSGVYRGYVDALSGIMTFLTRSTEDLVVLYEANIVGNIDILKILDRHIESGSDITLCYKNGKFPQNRKNSMVLTINDSQVVKDIAFWDNSRSNVDYSVAIMVVTRQKLIELIEEADQNRYIDFMIEVLKEKTEQLKISAYKLEGFCEIIDSEDKYVKVSNMLLGKKVRKQLFNRANPIYTKTRDDMPTRYGINAKTENSIIADGCIIEGIVKNSILFRGVKVLSGATVENCIVMQGGKISNDCRLKYVTMDKNALISEGIVLQGRKKKNIFISKNKTI